VRRSLAAPFYGTAVLLGIVLVLEWLPAAEPPPVKPAPVPRTGAVASDAVEAKDTEDWADTILKRPLFTVGRRPPKTAHGKPLFSTNGMPRLSGIMITKAGRRAIFAPDGGKTLVLAEGATLEDGTIRSISADRVIISGPKGDITLQPTYDHGKTGGLITPTTPMFPQPGMNPGFPNPGFNPAFPGQANFRPPQFQPPVPQPQPQNDSPQPAADGGDNTNDDNSDATPPPPQPMPPQPFPGARPGIPRER
jgi:hypothetical protein